MRSDRERLLDILEAIERIQRYATRGRQAFESDELIQTWVVHYLAIIGEAASRLSDTLRLSHSEVAWPNIIAMRNILIHEYFGIDLNEVWSTVEYDVPDLKRRVEAILRERGGA